MVSTIRKACFLLGTASEKVTFLFCVYPGNISISQHTNASFRSQEPDEYRSETTLLDVLPTSSMFYPNTELVNLKLTLNTQASPYFLSADKRFFSKLSADLYSCLPDINAYQCL